MKLADTNYDNSETGCCAKLDVERWDGQEFTWKDKLFLKDHIHAFLHIPLNFGAVITRDQKAIEGAAAYPEDPIWLTEDTSLWGSDIYVSIDREIPDVAIEKLSGVFLTKVFEGPYRNVGKWMKEMDDHVRATGRKPKKIYSYYANCPKCAKQFGKNHVVLFAQVE